MEFAMSEEGIGGFVVKKVDEKVGTLNSELMDRANAVMKKVDTLDESLKDLVSKGDFDKVQTEVTDALKAMEGLKDIVSPTQMEAMVKTHVDSLMQLRQQESAIEKVDYFVSEELLKSEDAYQKHAPYVHDPSYNIRVQQKFAPSYRRAHQPPYPNQQHQQR